MPVMTMVMASGRSARDSKMPFMTMEGSSDRFVRDNKMAGYDNGSKFCTFC